MNSKLKMTFYTMARTHGKVTITICQICNLIYNQKLMETKHFLKQLFNLHQKKFNFKGKGII
jgi:hypothetical protein